MAGSVRWAEAGAGGSRTRRQVSCHGRGRIPILRRRCCPYVQKQGLSALLARRTTAPAPRMQGRCRSPELRCLHALHQDFLDGAGASPAQLTSLKVGLVGRETHERTVHEDNFLEEKSQNCPLRQVCRYSRWKPLESRSLVVAHRSEVWLYAAQCVCCPAHPNPESTQRGGQGQFAFSSQTVVWDQVRRMHVGP